MSTISSFRSIENKHDVYRGKGCMKELCEFLRELAMEIINFKKNKMRLLTKEQQEHIKIQKSVICKEKSENKCLKNKKYPKVRDHCHHTGACRGPAHSICNLKYSVPKTIPIVFHNGSNYDYYFIITELTEKIKKQFTCL